MDRKGLSPYYIYVNSACLKVPLNHTLGEFEGRSPSPLKTQSLS